GTYTSLPALSLSSKLHHYHLRSLPIEHNLCEPDTAPSTWSKETKATICEFEDDLEEPLISAS
nr:hypothetical protein [Tanacetum cinerariifolium]